jgi:competence protein ComGF
VDPNIRAIQDLLSNEKSNKTIHNEQSNEQVIDTIESNNANNIDEVIIYETIFRTMRRTHIISFRFQLNISFRLNSPIMMRIW